MSKRLLVVAGVSAACLWSAPAVGQCGVHWLGGVSFNSEVRKLCPWRGGVVAVGPFTEFAGMPAEGLAFWDGASWNPLPPVPGGIPQEVVDFNGSLVAGQYILGDGGWSQLGETLNGVVSALAVYRGELYAGGTFTHWNDVAAFRLARWTGTYWQQIGQGLDGPVYDLVVHQDRLIACGGFSSPSIGVTSGLAQWDGVSLSGMEGAMAPSTPRRMAVIGDELFVSGYAGLNGWMATYDGQRWRMPFTTTNMEPAGVVAYDGAVYVGAARQFIVRRQGVWTQTPAYLSSTGYATTWALAVHRGRVLVGGSFNSAGGEGAGNIAWLSVPSADFDGDGDHGTEQDIEAFFRCLSGGCCATCGTLDVNGDGDEGTEQDIEAFFRVLAGGCA